MEILSRAASDVHNTSAMSAKCIPFKNWFIPDNKKKKQSHRARSDN